MEESEKQRKLRILAFKSLTLSRTCEGPPEYSGRGGRQLYTHHLVFDADFLDVVVGHPMTVYRDAMALGLLLYQSNPAEVLKPAKLSTLHTRLAPADWARRADLLGLPPLQPLCDRLVAGKPVC